MHRNGLDPTRSSRDRVLSAGLFAISGVVYAFIQVADLR